MASWNRLQDSEQMLGDAKLSAQLQDSPCERLSSSGSVTH
jgi:hypothetical protein